MDTEWDLAEVADNVRLVATERGVLIEVAAGLAQDWREKPLHVLNPETRLGRLLPTLVPQLVDLDVAAPCPEGFLIEHERFAEIEAYDVDAFADAIEWAPFSLALESTGWLGGKSHAYRYEFYLGVKPVAVERVGSILRRTGRCFRLDVQTFRLLQAIDQFNTLPIDQKQSVEAFGRFAEIKGLAQSIGAQLDRYLATERVLVPSRIGLDLVLEPQERISFAPRIDGVPEGAMRAAFFSQDDVDAVYVTNDESGDRIRVVLQDRHREVLKRMQRVRHLGGAERAAVLRDPTAVFDEVADAVDIDLAIFGQRVKGIGNFPFVAQPFIGVASGALQVPDEVLAINAGILCRYFDGREDRIPIASADDAQRIQEQARAALHSGKDIIEIGDRSIVVDPSFVSALEELKIRLGLPVPDGRAGTSKKKRESPSRYLLIYTNDAEVEYAEPLGGGPELVPFEIPRSLCDPERLKPHQLAGASWLFRNYMGAKRGCLLADDMGLGKTLQVLTFLAAVIEQDELNGQGDRTGPFIVVCPTILLENRTWTTDAETFFKHEGIIFQPWLVLHGHELKRMRRNVGAEALIGEPVLDLDVLKSHRLIVTNYETVTNYQHSFARLKNDVHVLVLDEAQEAKTPNTKISHALKSLSPRFRIACTGTPVETRLLDAWNLFDFLQPGLLGSANEFVKSFESEIVERTTESPTAVQTLKERLRFGKRDAFVIRRSKEDTLVGLPRKHEHLLKCELTEEQRAWHLSLISQVKQNGAHALTVLKDLIRLYQHPGLVPSLVPMNATEALSRCDKLAATIRCIEQIQDSAAKCLVFTRTLDMQQVLAHVIRDRFGIEVDIINGAVGRRQTGAQRTTRATVLERFKRQPGFNVLILSPEVAGVGLTIVEANHVIHYGRWWNPAKESQATDRAYRLGQTRDVHVYYPVATDPHRQFETFDEKLDALLRRRRALATEFLAPLPSEEDLGRELVDGLMDVEASDQARVRLSPEHVKTLSWSAFEALAAAIEQANGYSVCLTPLTGDDGIDVIASNKTELHLIQCKHTGWGSRVDDDVVTEVIAAFDGYRARYLSSRQRQKRIVPIVITNGEFTKIARREATKAGVLLTSGAELQLAIMSTQISAAAIEMLNQRRLASMGAVKAWLDSEDRRETH